MSATVGARARPDPQTSGVFAAALGSAALFGLSLVLPVLLLVGVVSPFPLIVQRLKGGLGSALMASLLAAGLLIGVFSGGQALGFLAFLVLPGLLIGESMARGRGMLRGCGWAFAVLAMEIGLALLFAGPQMAALLLDPPKALRSPAFLEELRASGLPPEQVDLWVERFDAYQKVFAVVYPAVFIIMGAVVVLANATLLRAYLARRDPGWLEGGEFEGIRWPLGLAVLFVAAGLAVALPPLRAAGYNVLLVVAFFFALQGLAVVAYYAARLAAPPVLRFGVMVLVLVNPWAPQILALLGLFDIWFDFRRWAEPPEAEES